MMLVCARHRSADDAAQRIRVPDAIASSLYSRAAKMPAGSPAGA
jgi:hypothetical protein